MAPASDDDEEMRDLFGSDDEGGEEARPSSLRQRANGAAAARAPAPAEAGFDGDLEDDLGDRPGRSGSDVIADEQGRSEDEAGGEQPGTADADGRVSARSRLARSGGVKQLSRTGAPIDFAVPLAPVPPTLGETFLLREALIGVEPRPFDPATYEAEEEILMDDKGITRIKPVDLTKIRWRYAERPRADGSVELVPESNARFVRWADGSLQLLLGEEVFDVDTADIAAQHAYMVAYSGVVQVQAPPQAAMSSVLAPEGAGAARAPLAQPSRGVAVPRNSGRCEPSACVQRSLLRHVNPSFLGASCTDAEDGLPPRSAQPQPPARAHARGGGPPHP
jgi:RNA polymerase-associated protein LEO1